MKPIRLPARYTATVTAGAGEFSLRTGMEAIDKLRVRGSDVVHAASAIEEAIVQILVHSLFQEIKEQRDLVVGLILNSDWCTFSSKRRLLAASLKHFALLDSKALAQLDNGLKHVISYRNAFAHGSVQFDGSNYVLKYFEGEPRVAVLSDDYWEILERRIDEPWQTLSRIEAAVKTNVPNMPL